VASAWAAKSPPLDDLTAFVDGIMRGFEFGGRRR
jgi:hypothetical protein